MYNFIKYKKAVVMGIVAIQLMSLPAYAAENLVAEVGAKAVVLIDAKNGRVLFEQNPHEELAMASTTKIMTALITLEQSDLETYFTVDPMAIRVEGSSMGLMEGDEVNLLTLAYGMILPSGNDAANAAAVKIAGSAIEFAKMMNNRAEEMGLVNTHYVTPSGLDANGHYSSAYDLALLTKYAMENKDFKEIAGQYRAKVKFGRPPYERWLKNHNKLLELYDKTIGVKTGFTDAAKRCLVSAAQDDGMEFIVVTLNSPDDFNIHTQLFEKYFAAYENVDISAIIPDISIPVVNSGNMSVQGNLINEPIVALTTGETKKLEVTILAPKFIYAPVKKGDCIGKIVIKTDNEIVFETELAAEFDVHEKTVYKEKKELFKFFK